MLSFLQKPSEISENFTTGSPTRRLQKSRLAILKGLRPFANDCPSVPYEAICDQTFVRV